MLHRVTSVHGLQGVADTLASRLCVRVRVPDRVGVTLTLQILANGDAVILGGSRVLADHEKDDGAGIGRHL